MDTVKTTGDPIKIYSKEISKKNSLFLKLYFELFLSQFCLKVLLMYSKVGKYFLLLEIMHTLHKEAFS